ncbi:engulfment and cell motility protein 3-like [Trichechus manatus latirostris]|uniref:Engulfment and cell motility protein 3-like n=1 Tax=Trichechus manatus latirostris TaxID=127582 RepID=A0A2Y9QGQ1_TRIMA|nr:engulfment and cell motility protein 3-like [Trichechus manatus latirostris]
MTVYLQAKPLAAVLKEVCDAWSLTHSERYALQFADGHRRYITENNRTEIKNGSILCLSTAPDLEAEQLLGGLQSGSREGRREALQHLVLLAPDLTFAREVISRDGLQRLGTIIEDGDDLGEVLALGLQAFSELMEHGVVSWETLSIPFVRKLVCYVNMNLMDASVQPLALGLLESVTLSSPALGQLVKSEVPLDRLLVHLQVMNQQLQTKAMALLTALLQGASPAERKHMLDYLWQRNFRQFIYKVGRTGPGRSLSTPCYLVPCPCSPPWTGCPPEHHPQCSTTGRRDGAPLVRPAGPHAGAAGATHADAIGPLQPGAAGAAAGPAPGSL